MKPVKIDSLPVVKIFIGGRKLRRKKRESLVKYVERSVDDLVERALPGLSKTPPDITDYDNGLATVISEISSVLSKTHHIKIGRSYLAKCIERLNKRHHLQLPIPHAPVSIPKSRPLRTDTWSKNRRLLNEAHEQWLAGFDKPHVLKLPKDIALGQVLYAAATHGGLCIPKALISLGKTLEKSDPVRYHIPSGLQWIDLVYDGQKVSNFVEDGEYRTCRRWFPPVVPALALRRYLKHFDSRLTSWPKKPQKTVWRCIEESFEYIAGIALPLNSLEQFCRVAFCISERQPNVDLQQIYAEFAIGRVHSMSLPPEALSLVLANLHENQRIDG